MAGFDDAGSAFRRTAAIVVIGLLGVAAALALLRAPASAASACTVHWTNPAGGE